MQLSEAEATQLANAWKRCEKYYPRIQKVFSDKVNDHLALITALTTIYGTRFSAIAIRVRAEQAQTVEGNVVDLTGRFHGGNKPN